MSDEDAKVLTEEEIAELGLQNLFEGPTPVVNTLKTGRDSKYRDGDVITYDQFRALDAIGASLENKWLRMKGPTGIGLALASKYQKWHGMGYEPLEVAERREKDAATQASSDKYFTRLEEKVSVFYCSQKYPNCSRFFDSAKALETHWGMTHEMKRKGSRGSYRDRSPQVEEVSG